MKRKVTDLKQNEAILISNDSERDAILQLMENAGMRWLSQRATDYKPMAPYSYYLFTRDYDGCERICWSASKYSMVSTTYPATDFIGSEGEMERGITITKQNGEVISAETVLLSEIRNKLTPIKNLIAMLESGFIAPSGSQELIYKEIKQCKVNIEELTRNTPNNEQR